MSQHGTVARYAKARCRCARCRDAWRRYRRELRQGVRPTRTRRPHTTTERGRISRAVRARAAAPPPDYLGLATAMVEAMTGTTARDWRGESGRARHRAVTRLLLEWAVERGDLPPESLTGRRPLRSHRSKLHEPDQPSEITRDPNGRAA